jgi:hypothetical protein
MRACANEHRDEEGDGDMDDERHVAAREEIRLEAEGAGLGRVAGCWRI